MASSSKISKIEAHLPPDLIDDILSRLPIKSIVICSCVCKQWRKLLTSHDPHFYKLRLSKSCSIISPLYLILDYSSYSCFVHYVQLLDFQTTSDLVKNIINLPNVNYGSRYHLHLDTFAHSCHGLVSFTRYSGETRMLVSNPVTREYIHFSLTRPKQNTSSVYSLRIIIGLGFISTTNTYKVLACHCGKYEENCRSSVLVLYNLDGSIHEIVNGTWEKRDGKEGKRFRSRYAPVKFVCFINGVLYWASPFKGLTFHSFNFDTKNYTTLPLPLGPRHCRRNNLYSENMNIGVLGDCLCFVQASSENQEIEVWSLNVDCQSWTSRVVNLRGWTHPHLSKVNIRPIKYLEDGKILMSYRHKDFLVVDLVRKAVEIIKFPSCEELDQVYHKGLLLSHYIPYLTPLKAIFGDSVKVFKA